MHCFLYEWVTGGGLLAHPGALPGSLLTEGLAMVRAVAEDFAESPGAELSLLQDLRVGEMVARDAQRIPISSTAEHSEAFDRLCQQADAVIILAPEIDGELLKTVKRAEELGAKLISPPSSFVELAGDKHRTAEHLRAAEVPAPLGRIVEPEDLLPGDFSYPAVLKPLDGAGSQDLYLVTGPHDAPPAYVAPRRLEPLAAGVAASVAVLMGPAGAVAAPPCRQRLSRDCRLRYLGGSTPLATGLAERAKALALAAIAALPESRGYVGVDLVLGDDPDGAADLVIEVNPRLTTSYAALRFAIEENLASVMLEVAAGRPAKLTPKARPLEFDADGTVSYTPS